MTPFVKWAGGKTQLLSALQSRLPSKYNCYFEPFIGGGAFLFETQPCKAIIGDTNEQLINAYNQLKSNIQEVLNLLEKFDDFPCNKELYLSMREKYNTKIVKSELDTECAALMIWINKHCFNGLYRVNKKGLFNVPYNNRENGISYSPENLMAISDFLQNNNITIMHGDFEKTCETAEKGDFVYFDSPYVPESITANFTDYTKDGFSLKDHERLANLFKTLDKKGVYVMLSNNDTELVHQLYNNFLIEPIAVKRMINRDSSKRTGKEVIITNYEY